VSRGILDGVQFSSPTVEFSVLLTQPNPNSVWLKDAHRVIGHQGRYSTVVEQGGLLHRMIVTDAQSSDSGVYTIKLRCPYPFLCYSVDSESEQNVRRIQSAGHGKELLVAKPDAYFRSRFDDFPLRAGVVERFDQDPDSDWTVDCSANNDGDFATESFALHRRYPTTRRGRSLQSLLFAERDIVTNNPQTSRSSRLPSPTSVSTERQRYRKPEVVYFSYAEDASATRADNMIHDPVTIKEPIMTHVTRDP